MQPHQQRVVDEKEAFGEKLEKLLDFIQTDFTKHFQNVNESCCSFNHK